MNKNTFKDIIKCSILGGIIINLFPNNTFAGDGVAMPGTLQYWGYGGILFNQQENIDISLSSNRGNYVTYLPYNIKNAFGLSPIGDFYRGEKKFIGHSVSVQGGINRYHYPNYNKTQEGTAGREWVYGVWEGRGGIYNLYDPKGDKWGECVPYYLSGSNRMNRVHNSVQRTTGQNQYTRDTLNYINQNSYNYWYDRRWRYDSSYIFERQEQKTIIDKSWQFHTPRFLGVYTYEELGIQFHIPYVVNEQGIKEKDINLISNAGHLNGMLNPDDVNFDFTFY